MNHSFDIITSLQYRLKAALAEVLDFKSGKKYQDMQVRYDVVAIGGEEIRWYKNAFFYRNQGGAPIW